MGKIVRAIFAGQFAGEFTGQFRGRNSRANSRVEFWLAGGGLVVGMARCKWPRLACLVETGGVQRPGVGLVTQASMWSTKARGAGQLCAVLHGGPNSGETQGMCGSHMWLSGMADGLLHGRWLCKHIRRCMAAVLLEVA